MDVTWTGIRAMTGRNFEVYRKTWKVNALPPLAEPFLYLLALGYGLGALIEEIAGHSYVEFIAPGIIAITMMQTAFMETTYSSYVRMVFQKTWDAVMATPLSPGDVLWGEVLWAATRATINATLMCVVVGLFGLLTFPTAFVIPVIAFVVGLLFAGIGLFVTARIRVIDHFSYSFFLFITPQFLFAGTFFPITQLPDWAQWFALSLPLTHAVGLTRAMALGEMTALVPFHILYLGIGSMAICAYAVKKATARIVQ